MRKQDYEYYNVQFQANSIQFRATRFDKGKQPHHLDSLIIVNAADLKDTNFACYFTPDSLEPQQLTATYQADQKALYLTSAAPLTFGMLRSVNYGSSNNKDLNLCNPHSFDYNIEGGLPDIKGLKTVSMKLTHMAGTLDPLRMTISLWDQGVINIRYTWDTQAADKRVPLGVPTTIVDSTPRDVSKIQDTLDQYITITDNPFQVQFPVKLDLSPAKPALTIKGLLFD
jgi:hypothetical protein